ncbi:MAG: ABC transporter permease [Clostridium sp.]|jgi:putative ABC transport system permease protein|nr:ABC transporter permease [Clostridium sp.]
MRNPLIKRLPRELLSEITKYLVIFIFMTGTIGFISGFLVAGDSLKKSYDESFEKYNIEDGNFELLNKADENLINTLEEQDLKIYNNNYIEEDSVNDSVIRLFLNREDVNKVCVIKGKLPNSEKEIAIDRMYANNNNISVGDKISVGGKKLKVTGFVALSDYSALFSNNNDLMFDSIKFGVGIITKDCFESFENANVHYSYSWKYNKSPKDDTEAKNKSDDFLKVLNKNTIITNYIPEISNQAIHFTGDDIGGDKGIMLTLLYVLIVIIAFVLAVTTSNTINSEASVIGTLRASGYTKGELLRHYMVLPLVVTVIGSCIGNILGYTVFEKVVANMYLGSYSLTTYVTRWNSEAFILTTIVPFIIMLVVNLFILMNKLSLSPLKFLRHNLKKREKKKVLKLTKFKFFTRFRLRVIFQNMPNYITLFIGILFASILLMFGLMMSPLLDNYKNEVVDNMISKYQYILKSQVETKTKDAEKYCASSLKTYFNEEKGEEISIYGIKEDSEYVDIDFKDGVYISDGFAEKYSLKVNDSITLKDSYGDKTYTFKIDGIYYYPASLSIFMDSKKFNETFDKDEDYFNGYFSNEEITDIDSKYIATTITKDDMIKFSRQLDVSMGNTFYMVNVFSVILYLLLMYLLSKLIIEKNSSSISMVKILGYNNYEIGRLYIIATSIVVVISVALSIPISVLVMKGLFRVMMSEYTGWFSFYINPKVYLEIFLSGVLSYVVIAALQLFKIKKIPLDEALKNME